MKSLNLKFIVGLVVAAMSFAGCDALDEADDVSFDTSFKLPEDLQVNAPAGNTGPFTSAASTLDIDDPNYEKYKDRIKDITVNKIEYTISNSTDPSVVMTLGEAVFYGVNETVSTGKVATIRNKTLNNHTGELEADAAAIEKIKTILKSGGDVFVVSRATLDKAPASFKVGVTVYVTIKANALK